jgi:hypothetical protein
MACARAMLACAELPKWSIAGQEFYSGVGGLVWLGTLTTDGVWIDQTCYRLTAVNLLMTPTGHLISLDIRTKMSDQAVIPGE